MKPLLVILVLLAVPSYADDTRRARPGRVSVVGAEYLPLEPGRVWVLSNEEHPERVTTVSVELTKSGALTMNFRKNHPDTYHGADGTNNDLIWFVTDGPTWIHAGNSNGDDAVGDAYPDDIRVSRDTGLPVWYIWLRSLTPQVPACYLIPRGSFGVPSSAHSQTQYFARQLATGWEGWSAVGDWNVRWDLVGPELLRVRFDETYADGTGVYEDWYLRRGVGLVGIRQWFDAARTSFRRGVASEVIPR